jgi:hypothetical protein
MPIVVTNASFTPGALTGVSFRAILRGYQDSRQALTSTEVPPFGTYSITQRGGLGARTVAFVAAFETLSDFLTMQGEGYNGAKGVLVWPFGSALGESATLESCEIRDTAIAGGAVEGLLRFTIGTE